jgi:hypothetical protein
MVWEFRLDRMRLSHVQEKNRGAAKKAGSEQGLGERGGTPLELVFDHGN